MQISDIPFGIISRVRNWLYDQGWLLTYKSNIPVICIGNITLGGNGKTPLVIYLANLLAELGKKPVVLSRGYGGSVAGPHKVNDQDTADMVGDEPLMLHRKIEGAVVVSRNRSKGAQLIEQQGLGDLIILDDGFQHRALKRDLDIICVYIGDDQAVEAFKLGKIFPYGRFRESKQDGFNRAQAIIFNSRSLREIPQELILSLKDELPQNIQIFQSNLKIDEILSFDGMNLMPGQHIEVDVLCGLAQPQAFFASIEGFGLKIIKSYPFADHHNFSKNEILKIVEASKGRPIICSEKDAVKLEAFGISSIFIMKSSLIVEPKQKFLELVLKHAKSF